MFGRLIVVSSALIIVAAAQAGEIEQRQLGVHVHGHGTFNIAFEGNAILMELEAPGADIVGFEYVAKSPEERAQVAAARELLADPKELLALPAAAGCTVADAHVELVVESGHHDEDDKDSDQDAHDSDREAQHAEFHARFRMECTHIEAVDAITFTYFEHFPSAEELEVNVVSTRGQTRYEVDRSMPSIGLQGLI